MNKKEAISLVEEELAQFRSESYADLVKRIDKEPLNCEREGPSGTKYQIEIEVFWDDRAGGNIRVSGSIDDGGWRAISPLCRDFIKARDGSFVGE